MKYHIDVNILDDHTMVCEGRVYGENGELCLKSDGTFLVVRDFTINPED